MIDWQRMWNDDEKPRISPTRAALFILSLPYRLIVGLRNRLYDRQILTGVKLPCPVISVGNITVGGTGKTPCVLMIAKMLQSADFRPAVISRGYGGNSRASVNIVSDGQSILLGADVAGDEPLLIARSLPGIPVITGPKRMETGRAAIERFGADVLVCDDAFQHRQICRDINVVLLDDQKPLGNGHLLPRGPLRESPAGLSRADVLVLTRADVASPPHPGITGIARTLGIPVFRAVHRACGITRGNESLLMDALRGKKVCAFCGIAKPDSFEQTIVAAGAELVSFNPYPDHHPFGRRDIEDLQHAFSAHGAEYLITTEKDAMRLERCPDFLNMVWVLCMDMEICQNETAFGKWLMERLDAAREA
jgi:tetraacyldisaccharide 4'-kinase